MQSSLCGDVDDVMERLNIGDRAGTTMSKLDQLVKEMNLSEDGRFSDKLPVFPTVKPRTYSSLVAEEVGWVFRGDSGHNFPLASTHISNGNNFYRT